MPPAAVVERTARLLGAADEEVGTAGALAQEDRLCRAVDHLGHAAGADRVGCEKRLDTGAVQLRPHPAVELGLGDG